MHMSFLEFVALLAAYALATARLLNAAKPLWSWVPTKLQPLLPALLSVLPTLAAQLGMVHTKLDLTETLVVALGALMTAVRGQHPVPPALLVLAFLGFTNLTACAGWKPIARTVDGAAEALCAQFFAEQKPGLSLEDAAKQFCATEADLKPWIDEVLAAKQAAGRAALAGRASP
jgi:hypothetical protein